MSERCQPAYRSTGTRYPTRCSCTRYSVLRTTVGVRQPSRGVQSQGWGDMPRTRDIKKAPWEAPLHRSMSADPLPLFFFEDLRQLRIFDWPCMEGEGADHEL